MITLRPYQIEARDAALAMMEQPPHTSASKLHEWGAQRQAALIAMATGSGKTEVWFGVLRQLFEAGQARRVLMISHTTELVEQPVERIIRSWPTLPAPGIVKARLNQIHAPIISASIQTLASGDRLAQLLAVGVFDLVFYDECHRIRARTPEAALRALYASNPQLRLVGASATPQRSDKRGPGEIFGPTPAYKVSIKDAIFKLRCVTNFRAFVARLREDSQDFSDVRRDAAGNYAPGESGRILSLQESLNTIVAKWREVAEDRPTIAFTASVEQTYALAGAFRDAGYTAEGIDGKTRKAERARIIAEFRAGSTQILVGCAVFIEGFDAPNASCALIARPTQHDGSYIQMLGRALRWFDKDAGIADPLGNADAIIIDVEPKGARNLIMAGSIMDPPPPPEAEATPQEAAREQGMIADLFGYYAPDQIILEIMDWFAASPLAWFTDGRIHSVPVGVDENSGQSLALAIIQNGGFDVWRLKLPKFYKEASSPKWQRLPGGARSLGSFNTFEDASAAASDYAETNGQAALNDKDRRWRKKDATAGQIALLKKKGVIDAMAPDLSRGDASTYINHAACREAVAALEKRGVIKRAVISDK